LRQRDCGHIAWLKEPNDKNGKPKVDINNTDTSKRSRPIMGSAVILPDEGGRPADKWSGQSTTLKTARTYSGSFALSGGNQGRP